LTALNPEGKFSWAANPGASRLPDETLTSTLLDLCMNAMEIAGQVAAIVQNRIKKTDSRWAGWNV
jgi:hypothetical protein